MKANEFVKRFGWGTSKFCLDICLSPNDKWFIHEGESIYDEDFDELKRLVESHKLVDRVGNIIECKRLLSMLESSNIPHMTIGGELNGRIEQRVLTAIRNNV